jgi:hypothetical protein
MTAWIRTLKGVPEASVVRHDLFCKFFDAEGPAFSHEALDTKASMSSIAARIARSYLRNQS